MTERIKENYRLLMTIQAPNLRVEGIRCKVYLPKRVIDPIQLHFFPTEAQKEKGLFFHESAIQGEITDSSGTVQTSIQAEKVYFPQASITDWGFEEETLLIGKPLDLKITHWINSKNSDHPQGIKGNFWLSPSIILDPFQIIKQSYDGNVNVETRRKRRFTLDNDLSLTFSNYYRYDKNEGEEYVSFPELVAEFEQKTPTLDLEGTLANSLAGLDDFLLIVSFAARQRCICLGWEVADSKRVTKYYRRDIVIPPIKKDHSFNDTLVHPSHFDKFIDVAYPQFLEFTLQDFLRQALWKVTAHITPVEQRILTLFSALEILVSWFRQKFQFSKILTDDNQWASFSKDLKDWIKKEKASYFPQREMRGYLYDKIPELNRISVTRAFNKLYPLCC